MGLGISSGSGVCRGQIERTFRIITNLASQRNFSSQLINDGLILQLLGVPELRGAIQRQHSTSWTLTVSDCLKAGCTFDQSSRLGLSPPSTTVTMLSQSPLVQRTTHLRLSPFTRT